MFLGALGQFTNWHKASPIFLHIQDNRTMNKETQPLNLSKISEKKLWALVGGGYLARRFGAVPGMKSNEYWTLTAMGENVWHLV
jgi:hypothetical protein